MSDERPAASGTVASRTVQAERTAAPAVLIALTVFSLIELLSIALLLTNLATVHVRPITATMGPVHGAAYLAVVVTALLGRGLTLPTRLLALLPVLGGAFMLWRVPEERRRARAAASIPLK